MFYQGRGPKRETLIVYQRHSFEGKPNAYDLVGLIKGLACFAFQQMAVEFTADDIMENSMPFRKTCAQNLQHRTVAKLLV